VAPAAGRTRPNGSAAVAVRDGCACHARKRPARPGGVMPRGGSASDARQRPTRSVGRRDWDFYGARPARRHAPHLVPIPAPTWEFADTRSGRAALDAAVFRPHESSRRHTTPVTGRVAGRAGSWNQPSSATRTGPDQRVGRAARGICGAPLGARSCSAAIGSGSLSGWQPAVAWGWCCSVVRSRRNAMLPSSAGIQSSSAR
jgi:hypothetical protein